MASPTFALTDILIRGRQTNSQVIVSGVPFHRNKKYKGRLIAGYVEIEVRIKNSGFLIRVLNSPLIDRLSSCQEIVVPCLAVAQVQGPKEWEYESYRTQKTWTTSNGGKMGSGKLQRQEKLIATLRDK